MGKAGFATSVPPFITGLQVDSDQTAGGGGSFGASGDAIDRFAHGIRSEFVHGPVIVDSKAVAKYPLKGISDYVAMLALTRFASLDTCSDLPSIVNLFATNCAAAPAKITTADIAYLKGPDGADLDKNLNAELGDMHEGMRRVMQDPWTEAHKVFLAGDRFPILIGWSWTWPASTFRPAAAFSRSVLTQAARLTVRECISDPSRRQLDR
jgi:hypothetical protein